MNVIYKRFCGKSPSVWEPAVVRDHDSRRMESCGAEWLMKAWLTQITGGHLVSWCLLEKVKRYLEFFEPHGEKQWSGDQQRTDGLKIMSFCWFLFNILLPKVSLASVWSFGVIHLEVKILTSTCWVQQKRCIITGLIWRLFFTLTG